MVASFRPWATSEEKRKKLKGTTSKTRSFFTTYTGVAGEGVPEAVLPRCSQGQTHETWTLVVEESEDGDEPLGVVGEIGEGLFQL
ncbi:hypothetical protein SLEP1_g2662 [Rubroshorea leprosula]|uniref:Uncharacterized protein n=1 Tax=Rubroshorea leprosula TaxID=152421 RepID=A0AAV5HRL3_9ROSI|nr:hypothetical protein SLEP1_g2662 [Rubroshorea leprosula]